MISKLRLLPLTLLAVLALALAACGGGSDGDSAGDGSGGGNSQPPQSQAGGGSNAGASHGITDEVFVSSGAQVLAQSAASFESANVTSMTGNVAFNFAMGPTALAGEANFAFEDDKMHMTMAFEGGDTQSLIDLSQFGTLELLVRDGSFYMNIPFLGGWFVMTPEDLGEGATSVQDLLAEGSAFDYSGMIGELPEGVEYVGDEDVNGAETAHYRFTGDLQTLIASFSDALAAAGDNAFADQITESQLNGPITVDVWVGKADLLPYKMDASANIETPEGPLTLSLNSNFGGYNQPAAIPAAPEGAASFADILLGLGLDPSALGGP